MKTSDWGEKPINSPYGYGTATRSIQTTPDWQERRFLKIPFSFVHDWEMAEILIPVIICSVILHICYIVLDISQNPVRYLVLMLTVFIPYLALPLLVIRYRTIAEITPDRIVLHRQFFRQLVIRKRDIIKSSVKRNWTRTLRWVLRIFILIFLPAQTAKIGARALQILEGPGDPLLSKLSFFLLSIWPIIFILVLYYNAEAVIPYPQTLEIKARSKGKLAFYSETPEELEALFRTGSFPSEAGPGEQK